MSGDVLQQLAQRAVLHSTPQGRCLHCTSADWLLLNSPESPVGVLCFFSCEFSGTSMLVSVQYQANTGPVLLVLLSVPPSITVYLNLDGPFLLPDRCCEVGSFRPCSSQPPRDPTSINHQCYSSQLAS